MARAHTFSSLTSRAHNRKQSAQQPSSPTIHLGIRAITNSHTFAQFSLLALRVRATPAALGSSSNGVLLPSPASFATRCTSVLVLFINLCQK
ncbi:hypothetical protein Sjap_007034 [Stephania japonica]|uniref:Uncharacterized protein n=1 Tax=Stephania japonica TaxID=461633 RepID=A0AAP0PNF0_9MAGN